MRLRVCSLPRALTTSKIPGEVVRPGEIVQRAQRFFVVVVFRRARTPPDALRHFGVNRFDDLLIIADDLFRWDAFTLDLYFAERDLIIPTLNVDTSREGKRFEIALTGAPKLHGIFFNGKVSKRDHVAVYVTREFTQRREPVPNYEITAHGFFALDQLPNDTTASTRARIIEVMGGAPKTERW